MKFHLLAAAILIAAPAALITGRSVYAVPQQGICVWEKNYKVVEQKTCVIDGYNSGLLQIITNNGTLDFHLHNSRLNQQHLDGVIYVMQGDYSQGSLTKLNDPSVRLRYRTMRDIERTRENYNGSNY